MPNTRDHSSGLDSYYHSNPPVSSAIQYANISSQPSISYYQPSKYDAPSMQPTMPSYASQPLYATGGPVQQPSIPPPHNSHYNPLTNPMPIRASSGAWTPQDDQTLMQARAQGMNWQPIQQAYFPNKTPNACRKRHERLMERRSGEDWDGVKLEKLAHTYMQMRRELWTPLANATGEKWNIVEAKCMSSGLKNLQTAARSHARRERMLDASGGLYDTGSSSAHPDDLSIDDFPPDDGPTYPEDGPANDHVNPDLRYSQHQGGQSHHGNGQQQQGGASQQQQERVGVQNALAQFGATGRLPSMDMGIDAIINRPSGR